MAWDPTPVAEKVVLALRGAPMLLSMLIVNLATLGMVTYLTVVAAEIRKSERAELIATLRGCIGQCLPRSNPVPTP